MGNVMRATLSLSSAPNSIGFLGGLFLTFIWTLILASCSPMPIYPPVSQMPKLDRQKFPEIDTAIESFIAQRQMPGAVFWLERQGKSGDESYQKAYGKFSYEADAASITLNTIFDAASLTKVIATAPAVMLLIEQGKVTLDAPLIQFFPECGGGGKEAITIRHLLTHTSGLPAGIPATLADGSVWQGQAAALKLACSQIVTHAPGTLFRYSDVNFILLGQLVQRVSGQPLNEFVEQKIYNPLGMRHTGYLPLKKFAVSANAPTQKRMAVGAEKVIHSDLLQDEILQGIVHDPTARRISGVAGHAGLFTTVFDLARFARMMVNEGELDGVRVLSRESVRQMSTVQSPTAVASTVEWKRSAGWDIDSPYARPRGALFPVGRLNHPGSYGHTGFTGCVLWIDPLSKTFYVLLSNRVYPNDKGNILNLYGTLGTLAAQAVAGFDFMNVTGASAAKLPTIINEKTSY